MSTAEAELLIRGMSFVPTPRNSNLFELNNDLFDFTRKVRLRYHFRDNNEEDPSVVKLQSTYTPPANEDIELERIIHDVSRTRVQNVKPKHRNMSSRSTTALKTLTEKVNEGTVIIKSADKGDVTVVMSPEYYYQMCMKELNKKKFYRNLGKTDPSTNVITDVKNFANHYRSILTPKEYNFLTKKNYSMAHIYMLPKLHKSETINSRLKGSEYIHLPDFSEPIEGRPIVGGPDFYTSGISQMIDIILKPILSHIPHILRDSFDFVERCNHAVPDETLLGTADIKALYTNLSKELVFTAIKYWVNRYVALIPILQRFGLQFILDGLEIILNHNYFLFDNEFFQQIHGFAMGTKAARNCADLSVAYKEVIMFDTLPQFYPQDIVKHIIETYFRYIDDVFYEWIKQFDVRPFQSCLNQMDRNLEFIFAILKKEQNYLDVNVKVKGYELVLDIFRKPTDSFNYLNYKSCHPSHTRNNIALSLARRIIRITSGDPQPRLAELKNNLVRREHPPAKVDEAFAKVFTPQINDKSGDSIVFSCTHNPSQWFDRKQITRVFDNLHSDSMKKTFKDCRVVIGTRQPKALRRHLIKSRFSRSKIVTQKKSPGLFRCRNCKYHRLGYIQPCKSFNFGRDGKFVWEYRRYFTCDSKNVIYILKCRGCWKFYIGETKDLKPRTRKHKSDVKHPRNSFCRVLSEHLRNCCSHAPHFSIFPVLFVDNQQRRRFIEKRLIHQYQPPLNVDG